MTYAAVHSAIRTRFITEWAGATTVQEPNVKTAPPDSAPWVRLNITDADSRWASMGDPGNNVERNVGQVNVQIFVLAGDGEGLAIEYADTVKGIFRSWSDVVSGVRFEVPPYARQIGVDGKWYQINVIAPFRFDAYA